MTRKQAVLLSIVALSCLALFTSTPASAAGRECPTDNGACFIVDLAGLTIGNFEEDDEDGDGDVDLLLAFIDGINDFLTILPDGRTRFHIVNHEVPLVYCPDATSELDDESCVLGMGRASGNGVFGGEWGACPGRFTMSGTGERISDGVVFELTSDFQVKASDCDTQHKFFITAEEVD